MPPPRRRSVERVDAADAARLAASRLRAASTSAKTQQHRPPKRARTRPGAPAPPDDSAPPPGAPRGDLETFQRLVLGPLLWRRPEASELGDIPLSFRDASHYVRAFEPALLEETREGVRGAWLESIGERRQFPLRLQHLAPVGSGWRRATLVPDDRRDVDAIRSLCPPSATSPNAVCVLCVARVEGEDPWPRAVRGVDLPLAVAGFVERVARDPPTVEVKFFVSDEVDVDVDRNARSFEPWHEEIRLRERATLEAFEGVRRDVRGSDGRRAAADVPADDAEAAEAGEIVDDASARDPPRGGAGRRWFLAPAGKLSSASTSYEALCNVRRLHPPMRDALMRRLRRDDDASLEGAANGDDDEDARDEDASGARPRASPPLAPPPFAEEVEAHPKFAEFLRASFNDPQLDAIRWSAAHTSRAWARATQGRRGGNDAAGDGGGGTNAAESGPDVLNLLRTPASPFTLVQGPPGTGKTHTVWGILNVLHIVLFARYQSALHRAIVEHADRGREAEEDGTFFPEDVSANDAADETARWASGFDALHAEDNGGGGSGGRNAATTVTELYASLARDAGVRRGRERVFGRTKPRILVCASSNAAVDNLLERVFVRGFTQLDGASAYRPPVVRVGASDAVVTEGVAAVCASTLVEDLIARGEREWDREYRKHDAFQREAAACIRAHERAHRDAGVEKARRSREAGDALEPCELVRLREEDDKRVREMCRLHEDRNKAVADMARLAYLLTHAREKEKVSGGVGEGGDAEPRSTTRERVGSSAGERALSRRHRVVLEASFVDQAEIVFTTLASSARDVFRRQLTHGFDTVLVDEAAQASETQTLVPFLLGAERCVLVGDPRQLPSTVLSGAAQEAKLQRSLFERFSTLGARIVLLSVQYRMHPEIRRFPSEAFYDGRLEDARSVLDREAADPLFFRGAGARAAEAERDGDALLSRPYVFFDAASGSASRTGGKTRNVVEAVLVACLYRALAEKLKRRNGDGANANANANASRGPRVVAVITPYRQQRVAILDAFAALCGGTGAAARLGVVVSTVDGFQGREADVVIFSAVRGGEGGGGGGGGGGSRGVGFLKDVRRVNVALTRAKRALWIVGHAEGLRRSGTIWETLVEDAERRGCVVRNADEREDVLGGATSAGERDDAIQRLEGGRDAPRRFGGGWGGDRGDRGDRGAGGRRRGGRDDEAGWGWGAPPPPPPREARD